MNKYKFEADMIEENNSFEEIENTLNTLYEKNYALISRLILGIVIASAL